MAKKDKEIFFIEPDDCPSEVQEQFKKHMDAFEQAKWSNPLQILLESGIPMPPSGELSDAQLHAKLWEVIGALALMGVYLKHTDHLNDRDLYSLLQDDVLLEEMVLVSGEIRIDCHVDLTGSGSAEDNHNYLKYYADDNDRALWAQDFPDEPLPGRERLAFDRDRQLPKPDPEEKFDMH